MAQKRQQLSAQRTKRRRVARLTAGDRVLIASAQKGDLKALWRLMDDNDDAVSPRRRDWIVQYARDGKPGSDAWIVVHIATEEDNFADSEMVPNAVILKAGGGTEFLERTPDDDVIASAMAGDRKPLWRLLESGTASPKIQQWIAWFDQAKGFTRRKPMRNRSAEIAAARTYDRIRALRKQSELPLHSTSDDDVALAAARYSVSVAAVRFLINLSPSDRRRRAPVK